MGAEFQGNYWLKGILNNYDLDELLKGDDLYLAALHIQSHDLFRELSLLLASDRIGHNSTGMPGSGMSGDNTSSLDAVLTDTGRSRFPFQLATGASDTRRADPKLRTLPCRLTTPELVEFLKMPTCRRGTRRVVLDHLGNIHGRHFANHWEFVRFAREQRLAVDLTTPPRRPDPADSVRRMLAILDSEPIP